MLFLYYVYSQFVALSGSYPFSQSYWDEKLLTLFSRYPRRLNNFKNFAFESPYAKHE